MAFNNHIIMVIRFSFPALGGYVKTPDTLEEVEAFLFHPDRLNRRFALFEALCLPSLLAQSDPDFTAVFLIGEQMPQPYRQRLEDLVRPLRSARVFATESKHAYPAVREAYEAGRRSGFSHRTTVRVDDDDALCVRYIERLRARADALYRPELPKASFAIAHNKGLYLEVSPEGNNVFDVVERSPLGLGLSLTTAYEDKVNVYKHHHRRIGLIRDLYSDITHPTFVRTVHRDNDAGLNVNGIRDTMTQDQIAAVLKSDFAFDLDSLMSI